MLTRFPAGSRGGRIAAVVAIIAVIGVGDRPVYAVAALDNPPSLLYMTPTLAPPAMLPPYPWTPGDLAVGSIVFDGSKDAVSGDFRQIRLQTPINDDACAATTADPEDVNCTTVELSVGLDASLTVDGFGAAPGAFDAGAGVIVVVSSPNAIAVHGKVDDVNTALQTLELTPDAGYYYDGSNPLSLLVDGAAGDSSGGFSGYPIEIRVLDYNDAVTLTVPTDKTVLGGQTLEISSVTGAPGDPDNVNPAWMLEDEDNDENDGDAEDDGTGTAVLVGLWATCGWLEAPRVGGLTVSANLESLLVDDVMLSQEVADVIVAAVNAAAPEFGSALLATGNPSTTPLTGFVGFAGVNGTIDVNYLLSQVIFHTVNPTVPADVLANATCDVFTLVSDLGNNGLPFSGKYVQGTGVVEIPFPTVDFDWFQVKVGDGTTIDASFNPTTYPVNEGESTSVTINITTDPALPATHPAFDLTLMVASGGAAATPGDDYNALAVTVSVPADATSVPVVLPIQTVEDAIFEGTETITMTIAAPSTPPAGFQVSTVAPTAVVSILDDEVDPSTTTTAVENSTTTTAVENSTTTTAVENSTTTTAVDNSTTTTAVENSTTTTAVENSTTTAVDNSTTTTAVNNSTTSSTQPSGSVSSTSVGPGSGANVPTTTLPRSSNLPETGASIAGWLFVASALVVFGVLARRGAGATPRQQ